MALFVNRDSELHDLAGLVDQAREGRGTLLMIEGQPGIGKTSLVGEFQRRSAGQGARVVLVTCDDQVGQINPLGPVREVLFQLHEGRPRKRRWLGLFGRTARTVTPGLLGLIPAVGPALQATASVAIDSVSVLANTDHRGTIRLVADGFLRALKPWQPLVIVIEDAHLIDPSSCAVLTHIADALTTLPVMIVLTVRPEGWAQNPALRRLVDDLDIHQLIDRMRLQALTIDALSSMCRAIGVTQDVDMGQLFRATGGNPLVARLYLAAMGESGGNRLFDRLPGTAPSPRDQIPERIRTLYRMQLQRLSDEDRRLLGIAAVQGETFQADMVADVAGLDRDHVATNLFRLAVDTSHLRQIEWRSWRSNTDAYGFTHALLQQTLYEEQPVGQRRARHGLFAAALERLLRHRPADSPEPMLELMRHHHEAGSHLAAATAAIDAARQLALSGFSTREVAAVCAAGLGDVRQVISSPEVNLIQARLIELYLTATEPVWQAKPGSDGARELEELSAEAIEAATAAQDVRLRIRMRYLQGKIQLYTRGVRAAIEALRLAWEEAQATADVESMVIAGTEYGRQLTKVDLDEGIALLRRVHALAQSQAAQASKDPVVHRAQQLVILQLGVNLVDNGVLGEGIALLREGTAMVRARRTIGLLPIGLNYLAQAEIATGGFSEAESLLREAAELGDDAWHANNMAHLGHLITVWHSDRAGLVLLAQASREADTHWQANLRPLVANLHAAALIECADETSLSRAEEILSECLADTRRTTMLRSEIQALVLMARLHQIRGETDLAQAASTTAIAKLEQVGWRLPTLNIEEIAYHHYRIMLAAGNNAEAGAALGRARAECERKAGSLDEPLRSRYLAGRLVNTLMALNPSQT